VGSFDAEWLSTQAFQLGLPDATQWKLTLHFQLLILNTVVKVNGNAGERRSWVLYNCWRAFPCPTQPLMVRAGWQGALSAYSRAPKFFRVPGPKLGNGNYRNNFSIFLRVDLNGIICEGFKRLKWRLRPSWKIEKNCHIWEIVWPIATKFN